jgi:N-acetylglucosamine-6-phosphate deacetylase
VQVIADGVHLAPEIVALVVASAASRFVLVSDALPATGAPDGRYRFGPVELVQVDGKARNAAGELAGSVTGLAPCIGSAVASGASLPDACAAATNRPAALLGRDDVGHLRPGSRADITVLDDNLSVTSTYISGELVI